MSGGTAAQFSQEWVLGRQTESIADVCNRKLSEGWHLFSVTFGERYWHDGYRGSSMGEGWLLLFTKDAPAGEAHLEAQPLSAENAVPKAGAQ
jgi:hypothetical protein